MPHKQAPGNLSIACNPCTVAPQPAFFNKEKVMGFVSTAVEAALKEQLPAFLFDEIYCLTTKQVAELTGAAVDTVVDWINKGKLRASKPGKDYLITVADYKTFLNAYKVEAKVLHIITPSLKHKVV
jgi:excisionase family DNA binding protein